MNVYLDESGDLGWKFDSPFREHGSSRYLTIAVLIVPKTLSNLPKRIVKYFYRLRKRPTNKELKGKDLTKEERNKFVGKVAELKKRNPQIKIGAITVKKENVQPHIQVDSNKLYNYMINLVLLDKIRKCSVVDFIPDPRTIKVKSGNSLIDYLQIKLWFEYNSATKIWHRPMESHRNLNLQFVDFIANIIWRRYEFNESKPFNLLKGHISNKELFF